MTTLAIIAVALGIFACGFVFGHVRATKKWGRMRDTYPGPAVENERGEIVVTHPWQLADALKQGRR